MVEIRELKPGGLVLFGLGLACDRVGSAAEKPRRLVCNGDSLARVTGDLGPGNDVLTVIGLARPVDIGGGLGVDDLTGGAASDRLDSGPGCDLTSEHLQGGEGNDRLVAGGSLVACASTVIASGGPGDDVLVGGATGDALDGDEGADTISGGLGRDRINGGDGDDTLLGEGGDDDLTGATGADRVTGGPATTSSRRRTGTRTASSATRRIARLSDGNRDVANIDLQDVLVRGFDCELFSEAPLGLHPTVRILGGSVRIGAGFSAWTSRARRSSRRRARARSARRRVARAPRPAADGAGPARLPVRRRKHGAACASRSMGGRGACCAPRRACGSPPSSPAIEDRAEDRDGHDRHAGLRRRRAGATRPGPCRRRC